MRGRLVIEKIEFEKEEVGFFDGGILDIVTSKLIVTYRVYSHDGRTTLKGQTFFSSQDVKLVDEQGIIDQIEKILV